MDSKYVNGEEVLIYRIFEVKKLKNTQVFLEHSRIKIKSKRKKSKDILLGLE
jgi:hypothetical protein